MAAPFYATTRGSSFLLALTHLAHELAEDRVVVALLRVPVVLVRAQLLLLGRWVRARMRVRVRVRALASARVRVRLRLRARARVRAGS